jgi:hypothetical protein
MLHNIDGRKVDEYEAADGRRNVKEKPRYTSISPWPLYFPQIHHDVT